MKVKFDISAYLTCQLDEDYPGRVKLNMVPFIKDTRSEIGEVVRDTSWGSSNTLGLKNAKAVCDCAREEYRRSGKTKFVLDSDVYPELEVLNEQPNFALGLFEAIKPAVPENTTLLDAVHILLDSGEYDAAIAVIRAIKRKEK